MSDLHARLRSTVSALAATDPRHKRFGARAHHYVLAPPLGEEALLELEARANAALPADYAEYVTVGSAGGAGPYYGLLHAERAVAAILTAPGELKAWRRALPLAHLGCGYFAVLALDGPVAGQVWLDARELELVAPISPSFGAFVLRWIDTVAHNEWPDAFVPIGRCALQAALSGYLSLCEGQLGLAAGTLAGDPLRDALAGLGPGAIAIAAEGPLFEIGDTVDPCIRCARMIENLAASGLDPAAVAPGRPPLPAR